MATGDAALREARETQGKGKEEGGTRAAGMQQIWCHHDEKIMGDGGGDIEAPRQRAWGKGGDDRTTAPPQAAVGAACVGGGDAV